MISSKKAGTRDKHKAKKINSFPAGGEIRNIALIILAGLVLRFIFYFELKDSLLFNNLYSDSKIFSDQAENMVSGGNWFGSMIFYMSPGYTYFLAFLYSFLGKDPGAVRIIQILLNCVNIYLIYLIGKELLPRPGAYISAAIASLFSLFILYSSLPLVEILFALGITFFVYLLLLYERKKVNLLIILAGITLGITALFRGNILLFYPAALYWIYRTGKGTSIKKHLYTISAFTAGMMIVILPVTLNNYIAGKDIVFLSTNFGINLYIGNHTGASGIYKIPENIDLSQDPIGKKYAEKINKREMTDPQVSGFWRDKAFNFISAYPGEAVSLNIKKILLFFDDDENPQSFTMDPDFYSRNYSFLLKLPLPGFFFILLFAAAGLVLPKPFNGRIKLIYALIGIYILSIAIFFVVGRFRIGIMPLLIILAGLGISGVYELIKNRAYAKLLQPASAAAILILVNLFVLPVYAFNDYDAYINLGNTYFDQRDYSKALEYYRKSVFLKEESGTYVLIGNALSVQRNFKDAMNAYNKAVILDPKNPLAYFNLGTLYAQAGNYDDALIALNMSIKNDSSLADSYRNIAIIYYMQENYKESLIYFEKYLYFSKDDNTKETVRRDIEEIKRRLSAND